MTDITNNLNHLLIGLGGTGGKVLKEFRKRLYLEYPEDERRKNLKPAVEFIYVDSTNEMMKPGDPTFRVLGKDASFKTSEFVNIKSVDTSKILNAIDTFPGLKYVVRSAEAMRNTLGEVGDAAGQKRRAGRILFASNCHIYMSTLQSKYEELRRRTGQESLHIHIFTGLAGGTGSGSIIDVITQTRLRYPEALIDVYAMVPEREIPEKCQAGRYHQNGYAALKELSALNVGKFLPSNVLTGEEHAALNTISLKQFGLILYSNVNSNGIVVDGLKELPKLVADAAYFRIFLKVKNSINDNYCRSWSGENYTDFLVEYNFRSKNGDLERARTKGVSSFGIKRVIYPENRIIEHVSYTVIKHLVQQMQFNNFSEDRGFLDEAPIKHYNEITDDATKMSDWNLDDSHLMLNKKILETEKDFKTINDFWEDKAFFYSYNDAKQGNPDNPYSYNYAFCQEIFNNNFRLRKGVTSYYKEKQAQEVIDSYVQRIIGKIEQHLFTKWLEGQYSMYDLAGICDAILSYIKKRAEKLDGEITHQTEEADEYQADHNSIMSEASNLRFISKIMSKKSELYTEDQTVLMRLFVAKTKAEALAFQSKLMSALRAEFEEYQKEILLFIGKLAYSQNELIKAISNRTRENSEIDLRQCVIEIAEDSKMQIFENKLTRDKGQMDTFAAFVRNEIVKNKTAHFGEIAKSINDTTFLEIATRRKEEGSNEETLYDLICGYHTKAFAKDKILGLNILEQLRKLLSTDEKITDFARTIINQSGIFLQLNDGEMSKAFNNNPNPMEKPHSINRKSVLIVLPKPEGDDSLKAFAQKLIDSLKDSFPASNGRTIEFDYTEDRANEITVALVQCCFPIRTLKWLPEYAKEYTDLINNTSEGNQQYARMLLHSEGDGTQLPPLEGEGEGPKGNDVIPYLFIASAPDLELLKLTEDENEEKGWCTITEGDWGIMQTKLISKQFTGLLESEEFTSELRDKIVDGVDEFLANPNLKKSSRDTIVTTINNLMREVVFKECSSTSSPKFQLYGSMAKKALDMALGKK